MADLTGRRAAQMPTLRADQWTKILANGNEVTYIYREVTPDRANIAARIKGRPVGLLQSAVPAPLNRDEVEMRFQADLASHN
jgi:hypothetical protein